MKYFIIFIILMFNNSDCFSQIIYNRIPEPIVKEKGKCIVYYKKKNKLVYIKNLVQLHYIILNQQVPKTVKLK